MSSLFRRSFMYVALIVFSYLLQVYMWDVLCPIMAIVVSIGRQPIIQDTQTESET